MNISDKTYDTLKFISIYIIPSLETFWLTVATAWNLPFTEQIGITIGAIGVFLAGCLGLSTVAYKKAVAEEHEGVTADDN